MSSASTAMMKVIKERLKKGMPVQIKAGEEFNCIVDKDTAPILAAALIAGLDDEITIREAKG